MRMSVFMMAFPEERDHTEDSNQSVLHGTNIHTLGQTYTLELWK